MGLRTTPGLCEKKRKKVKEAKKVGQDRGREDSQVEGFSWDTLKDCYIYNKTSYFTIFFQVNLIYANYLTALQNFLRDEMIYCVVQHDKIFQLLELELGNIHGWEGFCLQGSRLTGNQQLLHPTLVSFTGPVHPPTSCRCWALAAHRCTLFWIIAVSQGKSPCLEMQGRQPPTTARIACT